MHIDYIRKYGYEYISLVEITNFCVGDVWDSQNPLKFT